MAENNNNTDLLGGESFWKYYKDNYLIVLIVTGIMTILTILTMFWDGFNWTAMGVLAFLVALNLFVALYSNYQYKQLRKGNSQ